MTGRRYTTPWRAATSKRCASLSRTALTREVNVRVEDPDAFNEPWSAIKRYRRVTEPFTEEVCAENNQHLFDYNIPVTQKVDF